MVNEEKQSFALLKHTNICLSNDFDSLGIIFFSVSTAPNQIGKPVYFLDYLRLVFLTEFASSRHDAQSINFA